MTFQMREELDLLVEHLEAELEAHPLLVMLAEGREISDETLQQFARAQYADCLSWIPMLALMRDRCANETLRKAIWDNIEDEAGKNSVSHVTMAQAFLDSLGLPTDLDSLSEYSPASMQSFHVMMGLARTSSEEQIAGWLLGQEFLVRKYFAAFRKRLEASTSASLDYLREHEEVDTDRHFEWLLSAIMSMHNDAETWGQVEAGLRLSGRSVMGVLDWLLVDALTAQRIS